MPAPFLPRPGIIKTETEYSQEGAWVDGDGVRFEKRLPEKIGGSEKFYESQLTGINRGSRMWRDDNGRLLIAFGTDSKLYVLESGTLTNITPTEATGTLSTDPFAMTSGSALVTVTHTSHARNVGDAVFFDGATEAGGITIDGEYPVLSVPDANSYVIEHSEAATSTDASGGGASVTYEYEISPGNQNQFLTYGYGVGAYDSGTYGTPRSASTLLLNARTWSLDSWGEDLIASPRGGNIYVWDRSTGGRATLIANAPTAVKAVFVTAEKTIIALKSREIAWCDFGDYTDWTPSATNSAGLKDMTAGSSLVGGCKGTGGTNLVWTGDQVFTLRYVPTNVVYELLERGSGAGLIAPHAVVEWNGVPYWMSNGHFMAYAGAVTTLPREDDIREFVFNNLTPNQRDKCFAGVNTDFGEIWFFYPTTNAMEPDRYVVYSIAEQCWSIGEMTRTSWARGKGESKPLATTDDGYVMQHETGVDDDGAALDSWIKSAPIDLGDGDVSMDIFGIVPDLHEQEGALDVTLYTKDKPNSDEVEEGPYRIYADSEIVDVRASGRQVAVKFRSNAVGGDWRLGKTRFHVKPASRRR